MSTLTELGDYVEMHVVGLVQAQTLFLGSRPDEPNVMVAIYEYPGGVPEYVQEKMLPNAEKPQIQVVARSDSNGDYNAADRLIHLVWNALAGIRNTTIGGTKYRSIIPAGSPGIIGRDTNDRVLIAFNATVDKEVSLVS